MKKRILVVDDDELILLSLEDLFSRAGFEVHTVPGGREALRKAAEAAFDLVVLDVIMPGQSGFDVCRSLRGLEGYRDVPVVMLTAKSTADDREKGLEAGATAFLPKPFDPAQLLALVLEDLGEG